MGNLRKLVASALTASDLSDSSLLETALDRIGALAFSDELGGRLWRVKWAGDAKSVEPALALLTHRCRLVARHAPFRRRLCEVALQEWLDENCASCGGRRYIMASESHAKHTCTVCDGTGLKRYSDQWRMRQLGLDKDAYRKWERRFATIHERIAEADAQAWRDVAQQLEKIHPRFGAEILAFRRPAPTMRATVVRDEPAQKSNSMPELLVSSAAG